MTDATFQMIPLECIRASATNPRKHFNEAALNELAKSISQHGVAQPILVRPVAHDLIDQSAVRFEIVAGERRYRASGLAGYATIPAIVRDLSDVETLEIQVIENLQRADLHPLEEAEGYEVLMKAHNFTADQLAEKVGKSKAYIYARLKLCALEPAARKSFYDGGLTPSTAILIARIPVKALQVKAVKEITETYCGVMSTRDAQRHIERNYMLRLKDAPFKMGDDTLYPSAGTCTNCPKRTGNQPEIFTDVDSADVCTDPPCFGKKREAHMERLKTAASVKGQTVISGPEAKKIKPSEYTSTLHNGYVDLSAKCYDDEKQRTYRQILGKNTPLPILLENPHADNLIEIVRVTDIAPLLAEKGIAKPSSSSSDRARTEEKKLEAKVKIEKDFRRRLFTAIREHSSSALDKQDLRAIAALLYRQCPTSELPLIHALYGWEKSIDDYPDKAEKLQAAIAKLDGKQAAQLILDLVLVGNLSVNTYNVDNNKPEQLLAAAKRAAVDPEPIKAAVKAEAKAKEDAKKKPALKKTPATSKKSEVVWPFPKSQSL